MAHTPLLLKLYIQTPPPLAGPPLPSSDSYSMVFEEATDAVKFCLQVMSALKDTNGERLNDIITLSLSLSLSLSFSRWIDCYI